MKYIETKTSLSNEATNYTTAYQNHLGRGLDIVVDMNWLITNPTTLSKSL